VRKSLLPWLTLCWRTHRAHCHRRSPNPHLQRPRSCEVDCRRDQNDWSEDHHVRQRSRAWPEPGWRHRLRGQPQVCAVFCETDMKCSSGRTQLGNDICETCRSACAGSADCVALEARVQQSPIDRRFGPGEPHKNPGPVARMPSRRPTSRGRRSSGGCSLAECTYSVRRSRKFLPPGSACVGKATATATIRRGRRPNGVLADRFWRASSWWPRITMSRRRAIPARSRDRATFLGRPGRRGWDRRPSPPSMVETRGASTDRRRTERK
jgi:hypothetical protein